MTENTFKEIMGILANLQRLMTKILEEDDFHKRISLWDEVGRELYTLDRIQEREKYEQ